MITELGISLLAGSLTTLNPCVFPILPLVIGSAVQANRKAPLMMGLGMALAFAMLGLLTGLLADSVGFDPDLIRTITAVFLIIFGLTLVIPSAKAVFTRFISPVASGANRLSGGLSGESSMGAFLMGMLLGLIWTPCSGPLLVSTLAMAAGDGAAQASITLGFFGLGAAIPLISVGYLSQAKLGRLRAWVLTHGDRAQQLMGLLLAGVGLLVITGLDKQLEAQFIKLLPQAWLDLTTRF
jgi:cytochrome c-type biogenesis protein